jgi:hypothetical protein
MLKTALRLTRTQWRYLIESLVLLPQIDLRLRTRGYSHTREWIEAKAASSTKKRILEGEMAFSSEIAIAVNIAGRRSFWATSCLRQALALRYFLQRVGIESELRIGVRGGQGGLGDFAAHAWVEKNGVVLIGGEHASERYVALT